MTQPADPYADFRSWAQSLAAGGFTHAKTALAILAELEAARKRTRDAIRDWQESVRAQQEILDGMRAERDAALDRERITDAALGASEAAVERLRSERDELAARLKDRLLGADGRRDDGEGD